MVYNLCRPVYALASTTSGTAPAPAERQRRPEVQVAGAEVVRGRALPLKSDVRRVSRVSGEGELVSSTPPSAPFPRTRGLRLSPCMTVD